jgi:hypothetical protein
MEITITCRSTKELEEKLKKEFSQELMKELLIRQRQIVVTKRSKSTKKLKG